MIIKSFFFSKDTFLYEVPLKMANAQSDDISQQYILKQIIKTELAFPYLKARLRVIERKSVK